MTEALRVRLRYARYLGPVAAARFPRFDLVGQDGGQSIGLADGRTLFVFADTLLAPTPGGGAPSARFLSSTAALGQGGDLAAALRDLDYLVETDGAPRPLLVATHEEAEHRIRFWPEHGVELDGIVYLYYLGIEQLEPHSTWAFRHAGCGLAKIDVRKRTCERIWSGGDWRLWPAIGEGVHLGVQTMLHDGHVLVYCSARVGAARRAQLCRVAPSRVADPEGYQVLASTSPAWSPDWRDACDLGPCSTEFSVSFNAYLGRYLMTFGGVDGSLFLCVADAPWGPWSAPLCVGKLPLAVEGELVYTTLEHPRFARDGGRTVLVSYCQPHFTRNRLVSITFA